MSSCSASSAGAVAFEADERQRSERMRCLIQEKDAGDPSLPLGSPGTIIQFWDDAKSIPVDVMDCLDTWSALDSHGFNRVLYDDCSARRFVANHFSDRYAEAFDRCRHPAMRSDYFRLCYLAIFGGAYVDADDAYTGADPSALLVDDKLRLQPMCYDAESGEMVSPDAYLRQAQPSSQWIYYVNNNPIIAPSGHPVLHTALQRATQLLLKGEDRRLGVQSTTGPGNLTVALVAHADAQNSGRTRSNFALLPWWERVAVSRWPLSYRWDERNWRLWDPSA